MSDPTTDQLRQGRAGPFYRRDHIKPDGRDLFLYGRAPHMGDVRAEFSDPISTGSILRKHPLRGTWAIYSPHRQKRTFKPDAAADPLAPARPGAITEIPFDDFELAIFGNKFPSLHPDGPAPAGADWEEARASGGCEVVVYSPEQSGSLATLSQSRRVLLIEALIERYAAHFAAGAEYVLPFENRGDAVGVTLHHPHGQLYAFPFIPAPQASAAKAFADGYDLSEERAKWGDEYTVTHAQAVTAFVPPYARFPYETWIASDIPRVGPWAMTGGEIEGLATLLGEVTARYDAMFGEPMPYMMSFQAAPRGNETFQFTVQFYPLHRDKGRVKYLAGVEQTTGVFTVDVDPIRAAKMMREAL